MDPIILFMLIVCAVALVREYHARRLPALTLADAADCLNGEPKFTVSPKSVGIANLHGRFPGVTLAHRFVRVVYLRSRTATGKTGEIVDIASPLFRGRFTLTFLDGTPQCWIMNPWGPSGNDFPGENSVTAMRVLAAVRAYITEKSIPLA
jgi:hypothetical protein